MCAEIVATRQRTHAQLLEQTHAQMEMDAQMILVLSDWLEVSRLVSVSL
jgi:hypothetical protein